MTPRAQRGFTLLELMLAMIVGSLVVAGGYALLASISRLDQGFARRLDTTMRLAFVQRTITRTMHSLVVAPEDYDPVEAARAFAEETERAELYDDLQDREAFFESLRVADDEPDADPAATPDDDERTSRREPPRAPARFRLGHLSEKETWEYRGDDASEGVRRLELLVARAPFGDQARGEPVRGALDLVPTPSAAGDRWRLQWTPIRPAGKPTVLLEHLVLAEWSVTDSRGRFDEYEAFELAELPWTLQAVFWDESGVKVDWMFDFGSATTSADPR